MFYLELNLSGKLHKTLTVRCAANDTKRRRRCRRSPRCSQDWVVEHIEGIGTQREVQRVPNREVSEYGCIHLVVGRIHKDIASEGTQCALGRSGERSRIEPLITVASTYGSQVCTVVVGSLVGVAVARITDVSGRRNVEVLSGAHQED